MNIMEISSKIESHSISASVSEAILLELLALHIHEQGKEFQIHPRLYIESRGLIVRPDGLAKQGFDDFTGSTIVEIKHSRNAKSFIKSFHEIIRRFTDISKLNSSNHSPLFNNLLIFVTCSLTDEDNKKLTSKYEDLNFNYSIWDISHFQKLISKYPKFASDIEDNPSKPLLKHTVNDGLNLSITEWKVKRDEHLFNLKKSFIADDVVLFLGAGVSLDAGIPTWNNLMSNLLVSLLDTVMSDNRYEGNCDLSEGEKAALVKAIHDKYSSPLQLVRFIRNSLGELFKEELRKIMYKQCKGTSPILEAITNLSIPLRQSVGLQGIVTYNFDDLLEENFKNKKVIQYRSIFSEAVTPSKSEIGIYHVHGFLPRTPNNLNELEDKNDNSLLVFSEEVYHQLMLDAYHWSNLVQLNYFRERTCLFIGMSMTDPNVRRLLEIARQKQPEQDRCKHYIILERNTFKDVTDATINNDIDENANDINPENIKKFAMVHQTLKEAELRELGLNVIWVDDHNEIPSLLDQLRQ